MPQTDRAASPIKSAIYMPPEKPVKEKPDTGDTEQAAQARLTKLAKDFSPQTVAKLREELKRIYAADAVAVSPLFGGYMAFGIKYRTI